MERCSSRGQHFAMPVFPVSASYGNPRKILEEFSQFRLCDQTARFLRNTALGHEMWSLYHRTWSNLVLHIGQSLEETLCRRIRAGLNRDSEGSRVGIPVRFYRNTTYPK